MKSLVWIAVAVTLSPFAMAPSRATADRHCAPVLESYYHARTSVLHGDPTCEAGLEASRMNLEEASIQAGICGCRSLQVALAEFVEALKVSERSCETRRSSVLDLDETLSNLVEACH